MSLTNMYWKDANGVTWFDTEVIWFDTILTITNPAVSASMSIIGNRQAVLTISDNRSASLTEIDERHVTLTSN